MNRHKQYRIYLNTEKTGVIHAADLVLIESASKLTGTGFRYTKTYLEHKASFELDQGLLLLTENEFQLHCSGQPPGIIDY